MSRKARSGSLSVLGLLTTAFFMATAGLAWAQTQPPNPPNAVFDALGLTSESTANSRGESLSADGKMVVGYYNTWSPRAFVWNFNFDPVTKAELGKLAGAPYEETFGMCISADGQYAAGRGWTWGQDGHGFHQAYFWRFLNDVWEPSVLPYLPGSSSYADNRAYGMTADASILVGISGSSGGSEAVCWIATINPDGSRSWTMESLGDLPGGPVSGQACAVSNGGIIVGASQNRSGWRAFRWQNGMMADLGTLGRRKFAGAWSISDDGNRIVGECWNTRGKDEIGFLWENGKMTAVPDLPGGKALNEATAISPSGRYIVGWGSTAAGIEAYIYDTVSGRLNTIKALLQSQGDVLPAGWTPQFASDVTDPDVNGQVTVVGRGLNPQGKVEGYRTVITP